MRNKDPTLIKMRGCSHELDIVLDSPQLTTVISFIINIAVCTLFRAHCKTCSMCLFDMTKTPTVYINAKQRLCYSICNDTQFAVSHYLAVSMPTTISGVHADFLVRVGQKYVENHKKIFFSTFREVKHKMPQG